MPTYVYTCDSCSHSFEEFQPITAKPVRTCPKCKRRTVRRLIQGGRGLIFKGSGFYATDYRSKGYQEAAKKEGESSGKKEAAPKEPAPKEDKKDKKEKKEKK